MIYRVLLMLSFAFGLLAGERVFAQPNEAPLQAGEPAHRSYVTADFGRVVGDVERLSERHTPGEVLLVLDVDNTLLAMDQDLGSDQWFGWQRDMQKSSPAPTELVAPDFQGLIDAQGVLFALSRMHPPEPGLPEMVRRLQGLGVKTLVLTSRGPDFRNATERELSRNGYDFSTGAVPIVERRGLFLPLDLTNPERHGLATEEAERLGERLRSVSYAQGVFMVAGQHKGYLLRLLLSRWRRGPASVGYLPKAIVFVDDRQRHVDDVRDAFAGRSLDLISVRYSREDENVARFLREGKEAVSQDWDVLKAAIEKSLPRSR